ncbi:MAG: protein-export chaperone SecB [Chthoniobacterales bacterium]
MSPLQPAPLSLDLSYPTLVHVVSDVEGVCEGYEVESDIQVAQSKSHDRRWRVQLAVKFSAKGGTVAAHTGEVTYVGIFTVVPTYPVEKMPQLVAVNAPSILYSAIRELVALLTGRGPLRTLQLPAVSFVGNTLESIPDAQPETHPVPQRLEHSPAKKNAVKATRRRKRTRAT